MLFQTSLFFSFFAIFFLFYIMSKKNLRLQNVLILIGSYVFYGAWDERFLTLIIASTATDYLAGIGASGKNISKTDVLQASIYLVVGAFISLYSTFSESYNFFLCVLLLVAVFWLLVGMSARLALEHKKKVFIVFSLVVNLGLLAVFKYFNFFAKSLVDLAALGNIELSHIDLNIILPVGISFYTFQTLSYTIDSYRGKLQPTHQFLEFAAFVSFFPQLVAGPVERASNLLPQFFKARAVTIENIKTGVFLFIWGMFKKVYIADNLAPIVERAFSDPSALSSGELCVGVLAFTFQIYGDFSGYSDMARGIARMLGFNLMLNFNIPYISRTPSEFWQRWHISLSSWLRDYLYISLGGNRASKLITYRNLCLTMILGGLWHGASWTFVLWGAFHGAILVIYRLLNVDNYLNALKNESDFRPLLVNILTWALMFLLTLYGWLIFRAESMDTLVAYTIALLDFSSLLEGEWMNIFLLISPLLVMQVYQVFKGKLEPYWDMNSFVRLNVFLFIMYCIVFLKPYAPQAFIYFDF